MELRLDSPTLALEQGQVLTLDDAAGRRVLARSGFVWITEEACMSDYVIGPGESHVLRRPGRTLVQALHDAWVSIQ